MPEVWVQEEIKGKGKGFPEKAAIACNRGFLRLSGDKNIINLLKSGRMCGMINIYFKKERDG